MSSAGHILLITGPAAAGKTTVAGAWAETRRDMCAHLSLDSFRLLIKSGYHDPRAGCNEEAQRQLNVARSNVASVALRFVESGISSVIDDVVFPNWEPAGLDRWRRAFEPFEIDFVAIIPQWEVILDRNAARLSVDKIPVEMLRQIYDDMSGWSDGPDVPVVDSSALSTAETISEIARLFPSGATGQPTP